MSPKATLTNSGNAQTAKQTNGLEHTEATQERAPVGKLNLNQTHVTANGKPKIFWAVLAVAVLMIIGGFGPWATAFGALSVAGTNGDGWFLIVGGLAAGALLLSHASKPCGWKSIVMTIIGLICVIVTVVDLTNISSVAGTSDGLVSPAWGIYVCLLSSVGLLAAGIYTIAKRPYAR